MYKGVDSIPETTITIPGGVVKFAFKLIPKQVVTVLKNKGIDLAELVKLLANPEINGILVEINEYKKNEKIVISLE